MLINTYTIQNYSQSCRYTGIHRWVDEQEKENDGEKLKEKYCRKANLNVQKNDFLLFVSSARTKQAYRSWKFVYFDYY